MCVINVVFAFVKKITNKKKLKEIIYCNNKFSKMCLITRIKNCTVTVKLKAFFQKSTTTTTANEAQHLLTKKL